MRALVVESTSLLVLADKHSINEWIAFSSPPFHGGKKVMRHGDSNEESWSVVSLSPRPAVAQLLLPSRRKH